VYWSLGVIVGDSDRAETISLFLQSLENHVINIAKSNHGATSNEIVVKFRASFDRALDANAYYHKEMAEAHRKDGDIAMANFHDLEADLYRSIMSRPMDKPSQ
jgi:hypothetical protein